MIHPLSLSMLTHTHRHTQSNSRLVKWSSAGRKWAPEVNPWRAPGIKKIIKSPYREPKHRNKWWKENRGEELGNSDNNFWTLTGVLYVKEISFYKPFFQASLWVSRTGFSLVSCVLCSYQHQLRPAAQGWDWGCLDSWQCRQTDRQTCRDARRRLAALWNNNFIVPLAHSQAWRFTVSVSQLCVWMLWRSEKSTLRLTKTELDRNTSRKFEAFQVFFVFVVFFSS